MNMPVSLRNKVRRFPSAGKLAAAFLALAAATLLRAGEGAGLAATNAATTNSTSARSVSTNALWFWPDICTNASQSDVFARADLAATNLWLQPYAMSTSSPWRTTATIEMGFFRDRRENGWFQEVGVGMERDINPGLSVGFGVGVGRATVRGP